MIPENPSHPLKPEHGDMITRVLEGTAANRELIRKCKECGLDFDAAHDQNEQHHQMARKLKETFFPHLP